MPKEVLALRDFGVRISSYYVDIAIDCKRTGRTYGSWTYFDLVKGENEDKFKEIKRGV